MPMKGLVSRATYNPILQLYMVEYADTVFDADVVYNNIPIRFVDNAQPAA